jgi:hypothetical protein
MASALVRAMLSINPASPPVSDMPGRAGSLEAIQPALSRWWVKRMDRLFNCRCV